MQTNLTEIKNYLKDKQICLLGNARSILNTPKDIDKYEIVCRMNRGLPIGKERYIGNRTDVLFTSTKLTSQLVLQYKTRYLVWMTKCQKLLPEWMKSCTIQNPPEDWQELKDQYPENKLPSTGCIVINFLLKHIEFKSLIIYGFDFMRSGTWYNNLKDPRWHPKETEEKIIKGLIGNCKNVEIIIE